MGGGEVGFEGEIDVELGVEVGGAKGLEGGGLEALEEGDERGGGFDWTGVWAGRDGWRKEEEEEEEVLMGH